MSRCGLDRVHGAALDLGNMVGNTLHPTLRASKLPNLRTEAYPVSTTNKLTDRAIQAALSKAVRTGEGDKLPDGGGLVFEALPSGRGRWRFRFSFQSKENMLSLGTYPEVPLKLARERRADHRKLIADGIDPSAQRKADKLAQTERVVAQKAAAAGLPVPGTFEHAARAWHSHETPGWSDGHAVKAMALLENDLIPFIGTRMLAGLTTQEVLKRVRQVEERGANETAYRVLGIADRVFRFAAQNFGCENNPTAALKGAVKLLPAVHRAAITDPVRTGELLRAIDGYHGTPIVRAALKLAPLVFLRPGELRMAEWSEFDLEGSVWIVPAARMKGTKQQKLHGPPHMVALASQAVKVLRELHPLTGSGRYVFPSPSNAKRPLSSNGVLSALRRMDFGQDEMTGHGFRAMARTMLSERLGIAVEVIEAQLSHRVPDALGRAYNRTLFLDQRKKLMQTWADYLDELRNGTPGQGSSS